MTDLATQQQPGPTGPSRGPYKMYYGGEWHDAIEGGYFDDLEPYSGSVFARVAAGGPRDMAAAIEAAADAFPAWAETTPAERAQLLQNAANIVKRRRDEIAELSARETGSTVPYSAFQQDLVANTLQQSAGWVYLNKGEVLQSNQPNHTHSIGVHRPLGVVVSFTPWNGANILSWRAVISPIAVGNTVVVKPSEFAPVNAGILLAEIAEEAGFPPGVINAVTHAPGAAPAISDVVFNSPDVRLINLIGGVKTARILAQRAGETLKRTVLELGGFNPMLILDDVDMDYAVRTATFGSFFHQGQICLNTRKIIIHRSLYDEFVEKFVARTSTLKMGDPLDPSTIIGPLITQNAVDLVHARVKDAIEKGAVVRAGGKSDGLVVAPTILTDVPHNAIAANEETFGPVVIVEPVDSDDEAVAAANRVMYGLTASILTRDTYRGFELAPRILTGIVNVNSPTVNDEIHAPMGGVRDSGWGRTGPDGLADFSDVIWINSHSGQREYLF
jgi:acyl-CoA reductase-like NAD-dependent aldehyde dehydrogenase